MQQGGQTRLDLRGVSGLIAQGGPDRRRLVSGDNFQTLRHAKRLPRDMLMIPALA